MDLYLHMYVYLIRFYVRVFAHVRVLDKVRCTFFYMYVYVVRFDVPVFSHVPILDKV